MKWSVGASRVIRCLTLADVVGALRRDAPAPEPVLPVLGRLAGRAVLALPLALVVPMQGQLDMPTALIHAGGVGIVATVIELVFRNERRESSSGAAHTGTRAHRVTQVVFAAVATLLLLFFVFSPGPWTTKVVGVLFLVAIGVAGARDLLGRNGPRD